MVKLVLYTLAIIIAYKLYFRFEISRLKKYFHEQFLLLPVERRKLLIKTPEFLEMHHHGQKADQSKAFYESDWRVEKIFTIQDRIKAIEAKSDNELFESFKTIVADHFDDFGYYNGKAEVIFLFKLVPIYERFFELENSSRGM